MTTLFYFLAIFPLLYEMIVAADTKKVHNFIMNMKDKQVSDMTDKQKNFSILQFLYFVWNIIGLFTINWPVFSLMLFLGLIPKKNIYIRKLDGFLTFTILFFILINYFHLNINTGEYFLSLFTK
jgi:hypothetical protein